MALDEVALDDGRMTLREVSVSSVESGPFAAGFAATLLGSAGTIVRADATATKPRRPS